MKQERKDLTIALVTILIALGVIIFVIPGQIIVPKVSYGISPNVIPLFACWLMVAMSVGMIINCIRKDSRCLHCFLAELWVSCKKRETLRVGRNVLFTCVICIAYCVLFRYLGFVISSFLAIPAISLLFGWRRYLSLALVTVLVPLTVYYAFAVLMQIVLPGWAPYVL